MSAAHGELHLLSPLLIAFSGAQMDGWSRFGDRWGVCATQLYHRLIPRSLSVLIFARSASAHARTHSTPASAHSVVVIRTHTQQSIETSRLLPASRRRSSHLATDERIYAFESAYLASCPISLSFSSHSIQQRGRRKDVLFPPRAPLSL